MRHTRNSWLTVVFLAGGLWLTDVTTTPGMAASVTYTFSGMVRGADSAQTNPVPLNVFGPVSRTSGSKNRFTALQVKSEGHATPFGSKTQLKVGSHQVSFSSTPGNRRVDNSPTDFSKGSGINSHQHGLLLPSNPLIHSWLSQTSLATLEGLPSFLAPAALPGPSDFPPSISTFSQSSGWRLPLSDNPTPTNPVTIVQGVIAPSTTVPLPASLIIAGIGLVALIGLGAGGLRTN